MPRKAEPNRNTPNRESRTPDAGTAQESARPEGLGPHPCIPDGRSDHAGWKQPRTRRRHLLALGIPHRDEVHMATRSRKGYPPSRGRFGATGWQMSGNSIVQRALTNHWLHECAFAKTLRRHAARRSGYAQIMDCSSLWGEGPGLIGTARLVAPKRLREGGCGPVFVLKTGLRRGTPACRARRAGASGRRRVVRDL